MATNRNTATRETFDERLNQVLKAATHLMAQVGYEKASMRAIARAAETSQAGLYHYVDSKERILFLIQFRTFSSLVGNLRERTSGLNDPVDQLRVMVRSHVEYFAADMAALKLCSHELDSLTGEGCDEVLRLRVEYYTLTRAIVDRILDKHAPEGTLDRHVATMSLFGALNWLYRWYTPKRGRSPSTVANQITAQFLLGILGGSDRAR